MTQINDCWPTRRLLGKNNVWWISQMIYQNKFQIDQEYKYKNENNTRTRRTLGCVSVYHHNKEIHFISQTVEKWKKKQW